MTLRPALPYPANLCYNGCEVNVMTKTEARAQAKALRKNLDLHAIGAAMTQQLFALQISEPFLWDRFGRGEVDTPVSGKGIQILLVGDGLSPLPAGFTPGVDDLRIERLVIFHFSSL